MNRSKLLIIFAFVYPMHIIHAMDGKPDTDAALKALGDEDHEAFANAVLGNAAEGINIGPSTASTNQTPVEQQIQKLTNNIYKTEQILQRGYEVSPDKPMTDEQRQNLETSVLDCKEALSNLDRVLELDRYQTEQIESLKRDGFILPTNNVNATPHNAYASRSASIDSSFFDDSPHPAPRKLHTSNHSNDNDLPRLVFNDGSSQPSLYAKRKYTGPSPKWILLIPVAAISVLIICISKKLHTKRSKKVTH